MARSGRNRRAMSRCVAFTLIELLVVMGIIAVLAGLLFPAFSVAREMAKKARAKSDVKQIEIALKAILSDYRTWDAANLPGGTTSDDTKMTSDMIKYFAGVHDNNTRKILYMECNTSATNTDGSFIDPWSHEYHAAWGKASIADPFNSGKTLYRDAAAWSLGGKDSKPVKSWE